ncbi:MAG: hypothetical protein ACLR78_08175 [Roseburia sp.]
MYHTEVVRDGNREYEERSSSVVSGSAAATSTKTPDTAVQPEASTQAGLSQTADKKPAVQNFFTEKDQEDKDPSQEKDAKQGTQLKKRSMI